MAADVEHLSRCLSATWGIRETSAPVLGAFSHWAELDFKQVMGHDLLHKCKISAALRIIKEPTGPTGGGEVGRTARGHFGSSGETVAAGAGFRPGDEEKGTRSAARSFGGSARRTCRPLQGASRREKGLEKGIRAPGLSVSFLSPS